VDFAAERAAARAVLAAAEAGKLRSASDVAAGGLFVTLAEAMLGARAQVAYGVDVDLSTLAALGGGEDDFGALFSETGAYLVEVDGEGDLPASLAGVPHAVIGRVTDARTLRVRGKAELTWEAAELEDAWGNSFARAVE
jgi:phosphoribosylformylglycinamidine (FGAM) synthase-like enzyme